MSYNLSNKDDQFLRSLCEQLQEDIITIADSENISQQLTDTLCQIIVDRFNEAKNSIIEI